jgi:F420-non-reducing hydrogenase iron-sulfur subunit
MCSGRVDPDFVMEAFREGADGVMVLGCHPGDCHYRNGNMKTLRRFALFERMLSQFGIAPQRFMLDWVSAGEGKRFQELTTAMTENIKKLGPLHLTGFVESEVA